MFHMPLLTLSLHTLHVMSSPSLHCLPQYYSSSKPRSDPLFEAQSSLLLLKYLCRLVHTALLASMMLSYDSTWKAVGGHMSAHHGMPAT